MYFLKVLYPVIDDMLEKDLERATEHPRRRAMNLLIGGPDQPVQALLNTFMPDSYARPHRHEVDEVFEGVRGDFRIIIFDEDGTIKKSYPLRGGAVVRVPAGKYHTAVCTDPEGGTIFETKECFYDAEKDKVFADWAPEEGSEGAPAYLETLKSHA